MKSKVSPKESSRKASLTKILVVGERVRQECGGNGGQRQEGMVDQTQGVGKKE